MNKLIISYTDCLESPRQWDNLGTLALAKRFTSDEEVDDLNDFLLGLMGLDVDVLESRLKVDFYSNAMQDYLLSRLSKDYIFKKVYKYEHSGIAFSTSSFSCNWDSGLVGIIYVSKEKLRKEFNVKNITKKIQERTLKSLDSEVNIYSLWVNNEGVDFRIEDEEDNVLDSCGGFYLCDDWQEFLASHIDNSLLDNITHEDLVDLIKETEISY